MKVEYQIILLWFIHCIADFVFQTKNMAMGKSTKNFWLFLHVLVYSTTWVVAGLLFSFNLHAVLLFAGTTFICHFTQDYLTSRWTKRLYAQDRYYGLHSFWSVIALDQFLHFVQLVLCYDFFKTL